MTDSPRFPGISVLNPCFLEAVGHHVLALRFAADQIAQLTDRDADEVLGDLLQTGVENYDAIPPQELEQVTIKFITHAHKIAQQQR